MTQIITLPAIKRIEGHGRVSLTVGDNGLVEDAHFDVVEFRGFERMLEGRMVWEMPLITSRICGVCPVSHHLAAVRAVDALYGVEIPRAAALLRELLHLGGFSQDHALHFFFLAGPDFLVGDGLSRDLLGVIAAQPDFVKSAIGIRKAGQRIVEIVGGRTSHPVAAIPGGMSKAITAAERAEMIALVNGMLEPALSAALLAQETTSRLVEQYPGYAADPVYQMAQMRGSEFALYDGQIRVMAPDGSSAGPDWDAADYEAHLAERMLPNSYANQPYLVGAPLAGGRYRVGPLARINIADTMPGPHSQALLATFRSRYARPEHQVLVFHEARMIELVASIERMQQILADDEVVADKVRVKVERGVAGSGIAAIEAPRGTLIHHYEADMMGKVTKANLIVATTNNVGSIDDAVLKAVAGTSREEALSDEMVLKMELGIRAHDPCLSCATHEIGRMPIVVTLLDRQGTVLGERGVS